MTPSSLKFAEAIASEWLRRVQAEYTSAARTSVFTHWLIQLGASPDLIRAGLRIVDDELAHAELSHAVVLDAQGSPTSPALSQDSLTLQRRHDDLLTDLLRRCVGIFCLGETVAVPLFSEMRKNCDVASARAAAPIPRSPRASFRMRGVIQHLGPYRGARPERQPRRTSATSPR